MAGIASGAAGNMHCVFACGRCAIVAAVTGAGDVGVINIGRCPCIGAVAVITSAATANVCVVLASCVDTIMAVVASAGDVGMINIGRCPGN